MPFHGAGGGDEGGGKNKPSISICVCALIAAMILISFPPFVPCRGAGEAAGVQGALAEKQRRSAGAARQTGLSVRCVLKPAPARLTPGRAASSHLNFFLTFVQGTRMKEVDTMQWR